jgi:hypothetical protein
MTGVKMPLRPGFTGSMQKNTSVVKHGILQRRYPIRATEGYNQNPESFQTILENLEANKDFYTTPDFEVIQEILKVLAWYDWESLKEFSHIVIEKGEKPALIIENTFVEQTAKSICAYIRMDELVEHFWQSDEEKERLACEEARRGILRSAGVFIILCAVFDWLGDL